MKKVFLLLLLSSFIGLFYCQSDDLDFVVINSIDYNVDTIVNEVIGVDIFVKQFWSYNRGTYVGKKQVVYSNGRKDVGTWTLERDTFCFEGKTIVFTNPFPDVYIHNDFTLVEKDMKPHSGSLTGYSFMFYPDGSVMGKCILQDKEGTLYGMWYSNGNPKSLGHYRKNIKVGKWEYWDENSNKTIKVYKSN